MYSAKLLLGRYKNMIMSFLKEYCCPPGVSYKTLVRKKKARLLQLFMVKLGDYISLLLHLSVIPLYCYDLWGLCNAQVDIVFEREWATIHIVVAIWGFDIWWKAEVCLYGSSKTSNWWSVQECRESFVDWVLQLISPKGLHWNSRMARHASVLSRKWL